ncbi:zinc finger protein 391-like [Cydia pomonella]|uniref:zinc finger protein 391-like n=1 Tax=Cydia pomonella TaxID=82600 RepID=UPI002ADDBC7F|nr:zinc finger protein 391-like [Cydia pomonella]
MTTCRTCLKSPANKNISELGNGIEDDSKQCVDIVAFCLDIKITEDSKITTNLCYDCYRKIISFYKFKILSLKNDAYLRSVHDVQSKVQKVSFYVDENGVKHANFVESDDFGPNLVKDGNTEIRKDIDRDVFSLGNVKIDDIKVKCEEKLGDTQTYEDHGTIDEETQTYEGHDTIEYLLYPSVSISSCPATDGSRDGGEPSSKEKDIKSKNIKRANRMAPKHKKRSSKIKDLKKDGKVSQGPHTCEQCGITVIDIKSHSLTHKSKDERKMLKCKACPKLFVSRGGRRRHFNVHHLGRKAKCDICNGNYVHLDTHIKQVHKKDELRFACVTCGRRFVSRPVLDQHMVTHAETIDKPFKCDLCPKKYAFKQCLRDHIKRTHENKRNYQCEYCTKTFYARNELINHLRIHTMERPFECGECGKAFTWKRALVSHMLVHSGIRDFKCQRCDQSCRTASDLKTHMITHTKEKRFSCQYCGKRFGRADSCRRHEAGHQKQPAAD